MTLPELVAELKQIEQQNENISRELKPYMDDKGQAPSWPPSWRLLVKLIFFPQKPREQSFRSELEKIHVLRSCQRFIRDRKDSVELELRGCKVDRQKKGQIRIRDGEQSRGRTVFRGAPADGAKRAAPR